MSVTVTLPHFDGGLDPSVWRELPSDLVRAILVQAAHFDPRLAVRLSRLSKDHHAEITRSGALHRSVSVRDRTSLARFAETVSKDGRRARALRNIYLCNRIDDDTGEGTDGASAIETAMKRLSLEAPPLGRSAVVLRHLLTQCHNLEYFHVWEPFSLGYPPEMSGINHLSGYPLDLAHQAFAAQVKSSTEQPEVGPAWLLQLREITISSMAIKPSHFDRAAHLQTLRGRDKPLTVLDQLESLHLHWPTLRDTPDDLSAFCGAEVPDAAPSSGRRAADPTRIDRTFFAHARNSDEPERPASASHFGSTSNLQMFSVSQSSGAGDIYADLARAASQSLGDQRAATLLDALLTLSSLQRIRLTRPSPTGLVSGTQALLTRLPSLQLLILELGWYVDEPTLAALGALERAHNERRDRILAEQREHPSDGHLRIPPKLVVLGKTRDRKRWHGGWLQWDESMALTEFASRVGAWDPPSAPARPLLCDFEGRGPGCWDTDEEGE